MSPDPLAGATSALRDAIADSGDSDRIPAGRDEAIARLAEALRRRRAAQLRRRVIGIAAIAATLALVVGFALSSRRVDGRAASEEARLDTAGEHLTAVRSGHVEPLERGARIGDGTELRTAASSEAQLEFDSGSRITIGKASRLHLVEQGAHKRFVLEAGTFEAKVRKLGPDERFVVATSDAVIEVRGTAFRVSIAPPDAACGDGSPTRLEVSEGVVVLRHEGVEHRVAAGSRWPDCAAVAAPTVSAGVALPRPPPPAPRVATPSARPSTEPAPPASATTTASSRLAEQNDLFQEAMRRKRSGDSRGALATLDRLRTTYADGPLSENADVERFRILGTVDRPAAANAARDYLARWPNGFARGEARALADSGP